MWPSIENGSVYMLSMVGPPLLLQRSSNGFDINLHNYLCELPVIEEPFARFLVIAMRDFEKSCLQDAS